MYSFYTPFPPSVNHYYVKTRNGIFISKKGKAFRSAVSLNVIEQLPQFSMIATPIDVTVVLSMPDKRIRDVDNYMKSLLDAITHTGLWEDDSLIDQLHIYRSKVSAPGSVYVSITDAGPVFSTAQLIAILDL